MNPPPSQSRRERKVSVSSLPEPSFETVLLSWLKPSTRFSGKRRWNKTAVYEDVCKVLKKHRISGSYIGLGASYIPEIYETLKPVIRGNMVNCESDISVLPQLSEYTDLIGQVYQKDIFALRQGDFFEVARNEKNKYAIVDLDMMEFLETRNHTLQEKADRILEALDSCAANRCCLLVWSLYGMKVMSEEKYNSQIRPLLSRRINKKYQLLARMSRKYCDNHIPIKVEIFLLHRRKKQQVEANPSDGWLPAKPESETRK